MNSLNLNNDICIITIWAVAAFIAATCDTTFCFEELSWESFHFCEDRSPVRSAGTCKFAIESVNAFFPFWIVVTKAFWDGLSRTCCGSFPGYQTNK